ncbi:MAG: hypothetical protein DHS20C18_37500 [Saprospiraceae bacterium]|nr:MAG: hypothetical protein DHS20C18_37500 [Saprospiraceae bacterium]
MNTWQENILPVNRAQRKPDVHSNKEEGQDTVILVFSRTPGEEASAKTFYPQAGRIGNIQIADRLISHTIETAHKTHLPVIVKYSDDQNGHTFGQRLANAIEEVFALGFKRVLSIGNDCPDITTQLLLEAHHQLHDKNLVLGPAFDGGVYLIGISKSAYHRQQFVELSWESAELQSTWQNYALTFVEELCWLGYYGDIDQSTDFSYYLASLPERNLLRRQLLNILVTSHQSGAVYQQTYAITPLITDAPLRAPPC